MQKTVYDSQGLDVLLEPTDFAIAEKKILTYMESEKDRPYVTNKQIGEAVLKGNSLSGDFLDKILNENVYDKKELRKDELGELIGYLSEHDFIKSFANGRNKILEKGIYALKNYLKN